MFIIEHLIFCKFTKMLINRHLDSSTTNKMDKIKSISGQDSGYLYLKKYCGGFYIFSA